MIDMIILQTTGLSLIGLNVAELYGVVTLL